MKTFLLLILLFIMIINELKTQVLTYPNTKKINQIDYYHGIAVPDPYQWLEEENNPEVRLWIENQNNLTFSYLQNITFTEEIKNRLLGLWNYERISTPIFNNKLKIFSYNSGLQNQNVWYVNKGEKSESELLIDPNAMSIDGTTSVNGVFLSNNGRFLGYTISKGGSDWNEAFVIDIKENRQLSDHLKWLKFSSLTWYRNGFFYSCFEPDINNQLSGKNLFHSVYYHRIGTKQETDKLIFKNYKDSLRTYRTSIDSKEQWLFLSEAKGTSNNELYVASLKNLDKGFVKITPDNFENTYIIIGTIDRYFLILTNNSAPRYKLMLASFKNPNYLNWIKFLEEQTFVMQNVAITKNFVIIVGLENAYNKIFVYDKKGNFVREIPLPGIGSISSISTFEKSDLIYFSFNNYVHPTTIYKYDINKNQLSIWFNPEIQFDFSNYVVEQVWYKSKDGTNIPMFLTMKKDVERNGQNRVLLYGYGGFNISLTPRFSVSILPFLESGGIYAVANIRGGGEFGKEWHLAGTKNRKQNVFDDFIAAAEFLIEQNYTSPKLIGIQGASNGGLLVAACANQRPDIFGVVLPAVGVLDMLRFHKFTIGWAWTGDYGCSENPEEFEYLFKYSPLHNIKDNVCYPATLVTTADHDDRVVPAHSFKYIATLQEKQSCDKPVIIRIETKAGHGAGKPISKLIDENADILGFLMYNLGMIYKNDQR